ncbi:hypothetical protein C8Q76DRAFT_797561 [Earliella scabrosa]|nr:hypothetical protein C8Q76DRAFT_797561 [Earliella scabrosa]
MNMNATTTNDNQSSLAINPLFSGACVELTASPRHGEPFDKPVNEEEPQFVFVIAAEIAPSHWSVAIRENDYARDEGTRFSRCIFLEAIDDNLLMAMSMQHKLTVALKTENHEFWYQLSFEYEIEFWGLVNAITRVKNIQVNRQAMVEEQVSRLRNDFLRYFSPKVPPYDDPEEVELMRQKEEEEKHKIGQYRGGRHGQSVYVESDIDYDAWDDDDDSDRDD